MLNKNSGFTLIELMIVVVIIGILAAIAIPNFISMQARAKEASVKSNCHTTQLAAEDQAVVDNGVYPAGVAGFQLNLPSATGAPVNTLQNPFTGLYEEPTDGAAGTPGDTGYLPIVANGVNIGYTITGFGENATAGPAGDGIVVTLSSGS